MSKSKGPVRRRIGRVSIYHHHGGWHIYHREKAEQIRRSAGGEAQAECVASLLNARLVADEAALNLKELFPQAGLAEQIGASNPPAPDNPSSARISVKELRRRFLHHHEHVLGSAVGTVARYATATLYLEGFASTLATDDLMAVAVNEFIAHLRRVEISPNGHANTAKRQLREKGLLYILQTCRSMCHFALHQGILPRHIGNPFSHAAVNRIRVRDAKPIFCFNPQQELAFFRSADRWSFGIHFTLAKTGIRRGELRHLLIEDLDLENGWLHVRGKPEIGWNVKTNRERVVPIVPELVALLRDTIGSRMSGPVFLRAKLGQENSPSLASDRALLAKVARERMTRARAEKGNSLTRQDEARVYAKLWQDAGAVDADRIRSSFIRVAKRASLVAGATCPKSWRHTFATLLQEANVDLLVRQETLGHRPASPEMSALGMTGVYTHTTPEFQRKEIERALRLRSQSLLLVQKFIDPARADKEVSHALHK